MQNDTARFRRPSSRQKQTSVYCIAAYFFPQKKHVLAGVLKMHACGCCMSADMKAALVVTTICLHTSFSILPVPFHLTFSSFLSYSCCLLRSQILSYLDYKLNNSISFWDKAHATARILALTLSLTQTDVIKILFISSQKPACHNTVVLSVYFSSNQRGWKERNCRVVV